MAAPERKSKAAPEGGVAPALVRERAGQGLYIVPDHVNVSGCSALFGRKAVRIQGPADLGTGLGRYPPDQPRIADIFEKNRRNPRRFDLSDNTSDIPGAGLGLGGNADRGDEGKAIGGGEIAEGVVVGDQLAAAFRDCCDGTTHLAIE